MSDEEGNEQYNDHAYWDKRYSTEEQYDWFATCYEACVAAIFDSIEQVYARRCQGCSMPEQRRETMVLKVLHLGIGNSSVCDDLHRLYVNKYRSLLTDGVPLPYTLHHIAVDYSEVVIDKMRQRHDAQVFSYTSGVTGDVEETGAALFVASPPPVVWQVADVRDLHTVRALYGPTFDVVVDKGTMDALQTNKDCAQKEHDIDRMLREVSLCMRPAEQSRVAGSAHAESGAAGVPRGSYSRFVQITWEIPYWRLSYTLRPPSEGAAGYAWGRHVSYSYLGESDLYRVYVYEVYDDAEAAEGEDAAPAPEPTRTAQDEDISTSRSDSE